MIQNGSWILRFRVKDKKNFDELKSGSKSIETRAATEKYRWIQKGDTLVIVCGKEKVEKKVRDVKIFKSIDSMVRTIPRSKIMPWTKNLQEMKDAYYSYPGYKEKLKDNGVIAFTLK